MRVLALEPYYGGSHQAFIDGWIAHSRHQFDLLTLPPHHWKWRMRHAAVSFAQRLRAASDWRCWDVVWCSSMLNLAELRGLIPELHDTPSVVYFHENQLAYPNTRDEPRDVHFAFNNWLTALSADAVWFNSEHNRSTCYAGLTALARKVPDQRRVLSVEPLQEKTSIQPPGISAPDDLDTPLSRAPGRPLQLAWAARWEHDKGPDLLLEALRELRRLGTAFRLHLMGERFKSWPPAFDRLLTEFAQELDFVGFVSRRDYIQALSQADVFISTAHHEFFGLSVMEAALHGCQLLLPRRLVYPELFDDEAAFYDGTAAGLAAAIESVAKRGDEPRGRYTAVAEAYTWPRRSAALDAALEAVLLKPAS